MRGRVVVIDYGLGNLFSVSRAIESQGAHAMLTSDVDVIRKAERLVLPGVGAFGAGMASLRSRGLVDPIREAVSAGASLLGICLGMQLLGSASEEFGEHEGLGLVPGRVIAIPRTSVDGSPQRVPFVGWAPLRPPPGARWEGTVLEGLREATAVYSVHSFVLQPSVPDTAIAQYTVGGREVCAAVKHGRVTGTQFHPEKSGPAGLQILARFLSM